jgi:hypothetical protein
MKVKSFVNISNSKTVSWSMHEDNLLAIGELKTFAF